MFEYKKLLLLNHFYYMIFILFVKHIFIFYVINFLYKFVLQFMIL